MSYQWRKLKRVERGMISRVYDAWSRGESDAYEGRPKRNIYPPGRRHDEYERGYNLADPMGDHHGRNQ